MTLLTTFSGELGAVAGSQSLLGIPSLLPRAGTTVIVQPVRRDYETAGFQYFTEMFMVWYRIKMDVVRFTAFQTQCRYKQQIDRILILRHLLRKQGSGRYDEGGSDFRTGGPMFGRGGAISGRGVPFPDGGVRFPDGGGSVFRTGGVPFPDGGVRFPDGGRPISGRGVRFPDGGGPFSGRGASHFRTGGVPFPDGGVRFPDGGKADGGDGGMASGAARC